VHLGSVHSSALACSAKRPSSLGCFGPPGETGEGNPPPPPDAGGSPAEFGRSAVVGRREIGLGVTSVDGDLDLGRRAAGGSPWRARGGNDDRAEECTGEVVGQLLLAWLVRWESTG
jgi:hypothetical protein